MYYVRCGANKSNMGDLIGPYLYSKLTGNEAAPGNVYFTCGSILQPQLIDHQAIVWGSGIIASKPFFYRKPKQVLAVRGPLSREALIRCGIDCPDIYGDPGLLLPRFVPKPSYHRPTFKVGIIPHYVDYASFKDLFAGIPGICVIQMDYCNPKDPTLAGTVEGVCRAIMDCECTVSSSLHGIIISHAYNIPGAWMTTKNKLFGDGVKYLDYFASVGLRTQAKPIAWQEIVNTKSPDASTRLQSTIQAYPAKLPAAMPDLQKLYEVCPFR
jgi:pyruvyltransferase